MQPLAHTFFPGVLALRHSGGSAILGLQIAVARTEKTLEQVLRGNADANIAFSAMRQLLQTLGFEERIRGSHHIFTKEGVPEILNLQTKGSKCKPYQVKQVRHVILTYKLTGADDD